VIKQGEPAVDRLCNTCCTGVLEANLILGRTYEYLAAKKEDGVAWKAALDCAGKPAASSDGNGAESRGRTIGDELADETYCTYLLPGHSYF
jgi:hypothetical protein